MADDPKSQPAPAADNGGAGKPGDAPATNVSPAPTEVAGGKDAKDGKPAGGAAAPPAGAAKGPPADALSDGTVPTVLTPGSTHKSVVKGKTSLTTIYRKADVMTTLLTFAGAVVASAVIFGVYAYLTRNTGKPIQSPGKVSTLSSSDLSKLGAFFNGNSAGNSSQVLTINSSTLFKNRAAVDSDLKVTGGVSVTGPTALGNLTVDQTSTLGVTNVRGQLTVSGPLTLQSPATLGGGANVKGDLATSGNGSFGGSVSAGVLNVSTISVVTLNLSGHLSITGSSPSAGPAGAGTSASVSGNDTAGTVTVSAAASNAGNSLVTVNFHTGYPRVPTIIITPVGASAARLEPYISPGASSFTIGTGAGGGAGSYSFTYWVVQ